MRQLHLSDTLGWVLIDERLVFVYYGTGTPEDKDEVQRREVSECEG
jgi:hypothetical protein